MSYSCSVVYLEVVKSILNFIIDLKDRKGFSAHIRNINYINDMLEYYSKNYNKLGILYTRLENGVQLSIDYVEGRKPILVITNKECIVYIPTLLESIMISLLSIDDMLSRLYLVNAMDVKIRLSTHFINILREVRHIYNRIYNLVNKMSVNGKINLYIHRVIIKFEGNRYYKEYPLWFAELVKDLYKLVEDLLVNIRDIELEIMRITSS